VSRRRNRIPVYDTVSRAIMLSSSRTAARL
jgi:hypothetical protein